MDDVSVDIHQRVNAYKKEHSNRIVIPAMSAMMFIFHIFYFRHDPLVYALWIYTLPFVCLNVFLSKPREIQLGRWRFHTRSEKLDSCRWMFNIFMLDLPAAVIMRPDADVLFAVWFMILWAARSDTLGSRFSHFVTVSGVAVFAGLGIHLGFVNWHINTIFMGMLVGAFSVHDFLWTRDAVRSHVLDFRSKSMESAMEKMKRDAMLGMNAAIVSHELKGPLTILKLMAAAPQKKEELAMNKRRLQYAVNKIESVMGLVLNLKKTQIRATRYRNVTSDLEILTRKVLFMQGEVEFQNDTQNQEVGVLERTSSIFFILHNLFKNAKEALTRSDKPGTRWVRLRSELTADKARLILHVEDNGPGLPAGAIEKIKTATLDSGTDSGHGLGLKFVQRECQANGFSLEISSSDEGTVFKIGVPTTHNLSEEEVAGYCQPPHPLELGDDSAPEVNWTLKRNLAVG